MSKESRIRCYCDMCDRETNHAILHSEERSSEEPEFWWHTTYSIVKCLGCDNIQFHEEHEDETTYYYDDNEGMVIEPVISVYPRPQKKVKPIRNIWGMPHEVASLYNETINCLNNGGRQLAAAGFRAIIETICLNVKIEGKTLEAKINNLAKAHIITAADRDNLHAIRFIGNDSIHGIKKYSESEVIIVAHIVNTILTSLYLIAQEVEKLDVVPIKKYSEFEEILIERLKDYSTDNIDILKNIIGPERRIIREDIPKFESMLQKRISDGKFTKLSLCSPPAPGHRQQYKIEE